MAQMFTRVSRWKYGYSPKQVDAFLSHAKEKYAELNDHREHGDSDSARRGRRRLRRHSLRSTSPNARSALREVQSMAHTGFKLVHGGYTPQAVDAAISRLEAAFVKRRRADVIAQHGEQAWLDTAYDYAKTLYPRLKRSPRQRFADARRYGYEKDSVDGFLDEVSAYFAGSRELTAEDVRSAIFPRAKNSGAYDMAVVDAYLDRLAMVLLSVE